MKYKGVQNIYNRSYSLKTLGRRDPPRTHQANVRLPRVYDQADAQSEEHIRVRTAEIKAGARKAREGHGNNVLQLEAQ